MNLPQINFESEDGLTESEIDFLRSMMPLLNITINQQLKEVQILKIKYSNDVNLASDDIIKQVKEIMVQYKQETLPKEVYLPYLFFNRIIESNIIDINCVDDQEAFSWYVDLNKLMVDEMKKLL